MWIMSCSSTDQIAQPADSILSDTEVASRVSLLAALRAALESEGVRCKLARKHRLILRYNQAPSEPSGMTDPQLHIFAPGGTCVATTDGSVYRLSSGAELAVTDPAAAAEAICGMNRATSPA